MDRLHTTPRRFAIAAILTWSLVTGLHAQESEGTRSVEVRGGTVTFDVGTNVAAIKVHGKSSALDGRAEMRSTPSGLTIQRVEAAVPVQTLSTGMGLRDEHMRKHVFATDDGLLPDLKFTADSSSCSGSPEPTQCVMTGAMTIRGTTRPFTIDLKVTRERGGLRVNGESTIKLSAFGIEAPSQLGVRTEDDVRMHVEFTAHMATQAAQLVSAAATSR